MLPTSTLPTSPFNPEQIANSLHPLLRALPGDARHSGILFTQDNCAHAIRVLLTQCKKENPDAGAVYWSTKVWRSVVWQAVFACIGSVHGDRHAINALTFTQSLSEGRVSGYLNTANLFDNMWSAKKNVTQSSYKEGKNEHNHCDQRIARKLVHDISNFNNGADPLYLIHYTAKNLRLSLDTFFKTLSQQVYCNKRNCYGLVADLINDALGAYFNLNSNTQRYQHHSLLRLWCQVLGLTDKRGLPLSQRIVVKDNDIKKIRRSCCKHIMLDKLDACIDCPQAGTSCKSKILDNSR